MSIQDVVEAVFGLPGEKIKFPDHPPQRTQWQMVHARVEGTLFMMAGRVDDRGYWLTVEIVAPVWPPE